MIAASTSSPVPSVAKRHGADCVHCQALALQAADRRARADAPRSSAAALSPVDSVEVSPEATRAELQRLAKRDSEVRAHERAHTAAAGAYATGGASFQYTTGPDGRRYATSGEVPIDVSPVPGDPDATIRKAETIRRAALAPADPSGQDMAIAADATRMAAEARTEKSAAREETSATASPTSHPRHGAFTPNEPEARPGTYLNVIT